MNALGPARGWRLSRALGRSRPSGTTRELTRQPIGGGAGQGETVSRWRQPAVEGPGDYGRHGAVSRPPACLDHVDIERGRLWPAAPLTAARLRLLHGADGADCGPRCQPRVGSKDEPAASSTPPDSVGDTALETPWVPRAGAASWLTQAAAGRGAVLDLQSTGAAPAMRRVTSVRRPSRTATGITPRRRCRAPM